jgi:ATP-dependent DNA helicase RecG
VQSRQIEGLERLQVLVDSNDGFYIAEQDLALRGPGELLGSRQAGIPGFQYLNIVKDQKLIKEIKSFT